MTTTSSEDSQKTPELERFIPISQAEITDDLCKHQSQQAQQDFRQFSTIFSALYHYKFHHHLNQLKECYLPFNPDADIISKRVYSDEEKEKLLETLVAEVRELVTHANYEELTEEDINEALTEESPYGVEVSVNLDDFAQFVLFCRGKSTRMEEYRNWKTLFITKKRIEIPIFKRLFMLLRFKPDQILIEELQKKDNIDEKKAQKKVKKARQHLADLPLDQAVFIKLFKNIPRHDLEMLFPNQQVRLRFFDKVKLAVTGGGGIIGGIVGVIGKVGIALQNPIAFASALFGLIGIIVRQVTTIFNHRTKYMMKLSKNLYFHSLDNNLGVLNHLLDLAEEEECKEAILAYYFLYTQDTVDHTEKSLDTVIENYLQEQYGIKINFEVDDGLKKLEAEGLLKKAENGILKVVPLADACQLIDQQWDNFFQFHNQKAQAL